MEKRCADRTAESFFMYTKPGGGLVVGRVSDPEGNLIGVAGPK